MMLLFAEVRYAAEPVGARDRRRSDRPSDWRTVREVGRSAPLVERIGSYRTSMLNKRGVVEKDGFYGHK